MSAEETVKTKKCSQVSAQLLNFIKVFLKCIECRRILLIAVFILVISALPARL